MKLKLFELLFVVFDQLLWMCVLCSVRVELYVHDLVFGILYFKKCGWACRQQLWIQTQSCAEPQMGMSGKVATRNI